MKSGEKVIKLRGHHLVCLHFFKGEGYNLEYVENLAYILKRAEAGDGIEVAAGADDVCNTCPSLKEGLCLYAADAEAGIREMDISALTWLGLKDKDEIRWSDIQKKLPDIFLEWSKKYCKGCGWKRVCEKQEKFHRFINIEADL